MAILRTFACDECNVEFESWDEDPNCPQCDDPSRYQPAGGHIHSNATKSVDSTAMSLMAEHGLTDMNDNQREGDTAQKLTASQSKMIDMQGGSIFKPSGNLQQTLGGYNLGDKTERNAPMEQLHRSIRGNKL